MLNHQNHSIDEVILEKRYRFSQLEGKMSMLQGGILDVSYTLDLDTYEQQLYASIGLHIISYDLRNDYYLKKYK